jgi:phosphoribosylformylglycinamidine cyclo-ligase
LARTYRSAGVDLDAADQAVDRIRGHVRSTYRPGVLGDVGGFAGLFALDTSRFRHPVLVASTDGVGTKAMVAALAGRLDTVGIDLVAMCVDDLVCTGAEALFLLDYVAVGAVDPDHVEAIVAGVADGCRQAGCALLGGELAEHPGAMAAGDFDLAGFAVGVVERDRLLTGEHVTAGDAVIGLPSPGLRSNGYALARDVLLDGRSLDEPAWEGAPTTLGEELLRPSVIYAPAVTALGGEVEVRALAHVTGGGLAANLARVLPPAVDAVVERRTWEVPPIFGEIQRRGDIPDDEMARVFNLGIGMAVVVPRPEVSRALEVLAGAGHRAVEIGAVVPGSGRVELRR